MKKKKSKLIKTIFGIVIIIFFFEMGIVTGMLLGYKYGMRDMAYYTMGMVDKVTIIGNTTISINETKIDQALSEMKNITIYLLNQSGGIKR